MDQSSCEQWPSCDLESPEGCPTCGSHQKQVLHNEMKDLAFRSTSSIWRMSACLECGSGYLDPRPTPESIVRAYASYYTHAESGEKELESRRWMSGKNAWVYRRWRVDNGPRSTVTGLMYPILKYWNYRVISGQDYRDLDGPGRGRRLLDVGCGNGKFLKTARAAGWLVEGVDFDPAAVAAAKGSDLLVYLGGLEKYEGLSEQFDEITLSHVIEHVYHPVEVMEDCYRLLKPGGRLWIETPNIEGRGHAMFGRFWRGLEPPRHLVLFTQPTLLKLMKNAGFVHVNSLPWRPTFSWIFDISTALAEQDGQSKPYPRFRVARKILAELHNMLSRRRREFITVQAVK